MMIADVLDSLLNLFSPRICVVCGRVLMNSEKHVCTYCMSRFPFTDRDFANCGTFTSCDTHAEYPMYSLFYYDKNADYHKVVHALKYNGRAQLGVFLGRMLGERLKSSPVDAIVPLPLHVERQRWRGYNQAERIARGISEIIGRPVVESVVERRSNTVSQTGLTLEMRRKNMEHVFELCDKESLRGKHLLVIDDVITTGATMSSCVGALNDIENVSFSIGCLGRTI